jgi:hypothetical protein
MNANTCYSTLKDTWTKKTTLHSSDFDPFKSSLDQTFKENYYNTLITEYKNAYAITPDNSLFPTKQIVFKKPITF